MYLEFTVVKEFNCTKEYDFYDLLDEIEQRTDYDKFLTQLWKLAKANPDAFDTEDIDRDQFPELLDEDVEGLGELIEKHYPESDDLWIGMVEELAEDQGEIDYCETSSGLDNLTVEGTDY